MDAPEAARWRTSMLIARIWSCARWAWPGYAGIRTVRRSRRRGPCRPYLELLEARTVPSAPTTTITDTSTVSAPTIDVVSTDGFPSSGTLSIQIAPQQMLYATVNYTGKSG